MTRSSDEFPFAIPFDQLMASLRPAPLIPLYNHADELDRLRAHLEALASLGTLNSFGTGSGPEAAGLSAFPENYGASFAIPPDQLMASLHPAASSPDQLWAEIKPAPLAPLNYPGAPTLAGYPAAPERAASQRGQYASNDQFIQNKEGGPIPQTYPDIANHPTIGFGHKLTPGDTWLYQQFPNGINKLMANTLFNQDIQDAEDAVHQAVGNVDGLQQNQFDSLVSFAFNVGRGNLANSTLAQKIKNRDLAGAADEFSKWVYARAAKSQGLINRRAGEEALFRHGIY